MPETRPEARPETLPVTARPPLATAGSRRFAFLRLACLLAGLLAALAPGAVAHAAPDLVIDDLQIDPTSGRNGTPVQVRIRVRNQGNETAAASTTRVRINTDSSAVLPTDTALCSSLDTPALTPGSEAEVGCTPTLSGRPPGTNWIWAIADVNKTAGQDVVDNDRASAAFDVNDDAPDLVVSEVAVGPQGVPNGGQVTVAVKIRNQGDAPALASTTRVRINTSAETVSSSDPILCNMSTPQVAVGATVSVSCFPTVSGRPPGTNHVWVIADVNKTAGQLVVDNDRGSAALQVSALASDLVVDSITANPTAGGEGTRVDITATIRNQGTSAALASVARFRINQSGDNVGSGDPLLCRSVDTPSLEVGKTAVVKCRATITDRPAGPNFLWVIADAGQTAGQSDLANDRASVEFLVDPPPQPDMTIRSVTVNPTSSTNGKTVTVTVRVANDGEGPAPATVARVLFGASPEGPAEGDAVLCEAIATASLPPGSTATVSCKPLLADLPVGPGLVWAVADAEAQSGEADVENNEASAPFTVLAPPAPDLVVESVTPLPASGGSGTQVSVTARIRNVGDGAALASTARFRLLPVSPTAGTATVLCPAVATSPLAVGAFTDVTCAWTVGSQASGPHAVEVTADVDGTAGQVDRSDDVRTAPFSVLTPVAPDLVVKRVALDPSTVRNGERLLVKARITNTGNAAADPSVAAFRVNGSTTGTTGGDEVLCAAKSTKALLPGETARIRCSVTLADRPVGAQSVWVVADVTRSAGQVVFSNDARRAALTVLPTDCTDPATAPVLSWPVEQPRVLQDWASYGSVPQSRGRLAYHSALDLVSHLPIAADQTPVYAAAAGEVIATKTDCPSPADTVEDGPDGRCAYGWGNYVVIRHGAGVHTVYAHLGEVSVGNGCVEAGQRIALAGSSGSASIPVHVHFGVVADPVGEFSRKWLGGEYYFESHPAEGIWPESDTGVLVRHRDPRDFMGRAVVRVAQNVTASRGAVSGGASAYLARGQEYVSYGELVPGFHLLDLPWPSPPKDGPAWSDDVRYGWVPAAAVSVIAGATVANTARVDGLAVHALEGIGDNGLELRSSASSSASVLTRGWAGQAFVPVGAAVTEPGTGRVWRSVHVPGTAASGAGRPGEAWLPTDQVAVP